MSIFTRNAMTRPKTSFFPLSHSNTLTLDMPFLVPILAEETIPGDKWQLSTEVFLRMQPMLSPIMQDVDVFVHYFHVPNRLLTHDWDNFFNPEEQANVYRPFIDPKDFISKLQSWAGVDYDNFPIDPSARTTKQRQLYEFLNMFAESSLADYLGIPVFSWSDYAQGGEVYDPSEIAEFIEKIEPFSAYPFMMYQLIYSEFYRDQTLEESPIEDFEQYTEGSFFKGKVVLDRPLVIDSIFGYDALMRLHTRAWRKDYFTSALPTPQSGPDVHLPLTGDAPVVIDPDMTVAEAIDSQKILSSSTLPSDPSYRILGVGGQAENGGSIVVTDGSSSTPNAYFDPGSSLLADMSNVTSATINELRRAVRAQEFLEKCARGGRRYIEMILAHFGVKSSDARLDRPEFLGGGRQPFTISEVLSHVGESDDTNFVLGEMGGHGVSYGSSSRTRRYFEEHGFIFAILSVLPKASYQQGLARKWTRHTLFDYAWPSFANLGEQEVYNREIYAQSDNPDGVFGYAPRYSEYKYIPSSVHGAMRSSLSYWHLGRIFETEPALNADFVHPRPEELKRIFAVQDQEVNSIFGLVKHHITVKRRLPKYGIPTL